MKISTYFKPVEVGKATKLVIFVFTSDEFSKGASAFFENKLTANDIFVYFKSYLSIF